MFRLMLVEDDQTIGAVLESSLRMHGYQVSWVDTGAAALDRAGRAEFDLVLLDLGLPGLDGVEVCRRLRAPHRPARAWRLRAPPAGDGRVVWVQAPQDDAISEPVRLVVLHDPRR